MENKYYTPEIEDLRVGYICEMRQKDIWEPYKVQNNDCLSDFRNMDGIRTQYLTREQIEAEGWAFKYEAGDTQYFTSGVPWKDDGRERFLDYRPITNILKITTTDKGYNQDGPNHSIKFHGKCSSINEFRTICKLLHI